MEAEEATIHFQMPGPMLTFQNVRYFVNLKRKFLHRKAEEKEILKDVSSEESASVVTWFSVVVLLVGYSHGGRRGDYPLSDARSDADFSERPLLCELEEKVPAQEGRGEGDTERCQLFYWWDTAMEAEEATIHFQMPGPMLTFQNVRYFVNLKRKFLHRKAEEKEILKDVRRLQEEWQLSELPEPEPEVSELQQVLARMVWPAPKREVQLTGREVQSTATEKGEEPTSTTAPTTTPVIQSGAAVYGPLPFAPGHPASLHGPPCARPGAQEYTPSATVLPLVRYSAVPDQQDVAGLLPDVAGAPSVRCFTPPG
ncbi:hypothetical protein EOD39_6557 [Acipenser ruthenus]|uniref:Uncharacterized protein n=1 Tax=Acipenser ruthenus TaxID=7906 RepID=A0A444U9S2_ACIRT|nr:hypothetical protein EOD39_6557 [Acipenser ruthenus]